MWIVDEGQSAPSALHRLLEEYTALFTSTKDDYIKERLADVLTDIKKNRDK